MLLRQPGGLKRQKGRLLPCAAIEEAKEMGESWVFFDIDTDTRAKMRASAILRQQWSLRLTLFIRQNCSLCTDAKGVMSNVWDRRPFEYNEIDVMAAGQTKWKNLYEFDTPVVRSILLIHVVNRTQH